MSFQLHNSWKTAIIIEHNPDIIKSADSVVEILKALWYDVFIVINTEDN